MRNNTNTLSQVSLFPDLGSYLVSSNANLVTESYAVAMLPFLFVSTLFKISMTDTHLSYVCLFVFMALQPFVVVFSQPGSGL
jgi:hypothetical protein